jgi:acyl-CoA synthetase (AMP-forming)/AMP-acid ligase II/1-acyl-sn-glycerol-3-phosphate acyltransferase/acyl carrier protein
MLAPVRFFLWALFRLLLSLRYRIRVHGAEQLRDLKGGSVVLPNHPAYIDPPLAFMSLWRLLQPRPLLYEGNFHNPVFYPLMKLMRAVPLPDMERPSAKARARTARAIGEVIEGLKKGENHILWPSGYLWRDGQERLGGAQAVGEILRAVPHANVILVRTRGVWGSMFSFAQTGSRPSFVRCLRSGAGVLLSNLLFLTPRRHVDITVERIDRSRLPDLGRDSLNPWLEGWYNAPGPETPTYVPYHFLFGPRTFAFPPAGAEDPQLGLVTPETRSEIVQILQRKLKRQLTDRERRPDMVLAQMGMDSLDRMDVTLEVEQRFGFSGEQSPATLSDLWLLGQGLVKKVAAQPAPKGWFRPPSGDAKPQITGQTVPEAFVAQALAHPSDVAIADDQAGALNYGRLLAGALTLSRRLSALPGTNVGLLLPASVGADMTLLALQLAGKVPVVLNWTTGPANLEHAVRLLGLQHVVTSDQFTDRLEEKVVGAVTGAGAQFMALEDIRAGMSRWELLGTLLTVRWRPGKVRSLLPSLDPQQPAVVLFTSGSEKAPKAVPLTHHNLLSNQRASLEVLGLTRQDIVLGFLPSFHSFGLAVTSLLPLLSGIKVVHHPDPTAASNLARKVGVYQPTVTAGTPTFINAILDRAAAKPEQIQSLRLIYVGAEKCPQELMTKCSSLVAGARMLEGYGITECSPVISFNAPNNPRPGTVGQPLPNLAVCVAKLEDADPLALGAEVPPNQRGILLVSGPSVFPGYIGPGDQSPFLERAGKRWYITGDLAELDDDGYIRLAGRLKRFLKVGGEMISLPALEEPLAKAFPPVDEGPRVAVEGTENPRRIVLFTTEDISLQSANDLLHREGLRGIMRFDAVQRLDKIPTLGTGKVDNKSLRARLQ